MPRKAFLSHLNELKEDISVEGISQVERGEDDGQVLFNVRSSMGGPAYRVTAIVSDVSDYPSEHYYFLSAQDDAPKDFSSTLERLSTTEVGQSLPDLLQSLSNKFLTVDSDGDTHMPNSQVEDDFDDYGDDESLDDFDDDVFDGATKPSVSGAKTSRGYVSLTPRQRSRIRADLFATKAAGFKVGVHGGLLDGLSCYVSASCRIGKLGISEEAMQAWEVKRNDYLILLINYQNGYKPMSEITGVDSVQARRDVKFAIGISSTYKPTQQECVDAFNAQSQKEKDKEDAMTEAMNERRGFRNCFISRPLNQLFDERLLKLLAYREMGMPWNGAERFYNDNQGKQYAMSDALADEYLTEESANSAYPEIVNGDHFREALPQEHAFPLVAMQFLLRHFVRCNEFCLVCHCKTEEDLGAIKPYVCEKPLCLYQYMSLGFGPSIEHEILTQPHVVDLLVSFCYSQARVGDKLKSLPTGLGLLVPPTAALPQMQIAPDYYGHRSITPQQDPTTTNALPDGVGPLPQEHIAKFNHEKLELLFEKREDCTLRVGDWIIVQQSPKIENQLHCRVANTTYSPTIHLSEPVTACPQPDALNAMDNDKNKKDKPQPRSADFESATFYIYEQNFDHLSDKDKRYIIVQLLDLLPSVEELRDYIKTTRKELSAWVTRLSPALAGLLRWVIASCRACIFQVDNLDATPDERELTGEHRLHGMPGWMQFRFAMGAPDKERRFLDAVNKTKARLNQTHPTIFAWHGSALVNWHSIIREGLHYNYVACGRAFGDGVYHSLHYSTSQGYAGYYGTSFNSRGSSSGWPQSRLNISCAMALSEIVNAPTEFQSHNPHLVVQHLDWIQTRYLFVQCGNPDIKLEDAKQPPKHAHPQDANYTPQGCANGKLVIPATAVSRSRRPQAQGLVAKLTKKLKQSTGSATDPIELDDFDDAASVQTLNEDIVIFAEEIEVVQETHKPVKTVAKSAKPSKPLTDFIPGQLDLSTLPLLQPPSYASPFGTKRLLSDFKSMVKTQDTQPLHELGWYLNTDPDLMNNLYQWIIELHTFDASLPIAKDLKKQDMTSVVLEVRFGKDFPISPPFVRVIRPRFLGFQQGGGGHVTMGGAICMELLTNNGWTAACTIESVLLQIKMAMESTDPRPARLASGGDYGIGEAVEAFERACRTHGWTIPADLRETTKDAAGSSNAYQY